MPPEILPNLISELPEVMFIQTVLCPNCGKEARVNIPAKPSSGVHHIDTPCPCGSKIRAKRDHNGSYLIEKAPCCYVVTASFGRESKELSKVERRCRSFFQKSARWKRAYEYYEAVGPYVAEWAKSSWLRSQVARWFVAYPIVWAVGKTRLVSGLASLYLFLLFVAASSVYRVRA